MDAIGEINERGEFLVEWSVKDFPSLPAEGGVSYFSPSFYFNNNSWCIELYPNGKKESESDEGMYLYLHRKSSGPPISMEYSFGIKGVHYEVHDKYFTAVFNETEHYGHKLLYHRSSLLEKKEHYLHSTSLILVCSIKCSQLIECSSKEIPSKSKIIRSNVVFKDYKELFMRQEDCDVIIKIKEQEFPAHKAILAARSPVLRSTFRSNMKEKETGIVDIEDCDPSSFSDFLCFVYCGEIETLSGENVFNIFTTADKYDVQDLREICLEFMKENISIDTFCDTITLALQYSEKELITLATDFFTKNSLKIVKTVQWQMFLANNLTVGNELIIKAFEAATGSNE